MSDMKLGYSVLSRAWYGKNSPELGYGVSEKITISSFDDIENEVIDGENASFELHFSRIGIKIDCYDDAVGTLKQFLSDVSLDECIDVDAVIDEMNDAGYIDVTRYTRDNNSVFIGKPCLCTRNIVGIPVECVDGVFYGKTIDGERNWQSKAPRLLETYLWE